MESGFKMSRKCRVIHLSWRHVSIRKSFPCIKAGLIKIEGNVDRVVAVERVT
jgi:hypothetical protein